MWLNHTEQAKEDWNLQEITNADKYCKSQETIRANKMTLTDDTHNVEEKP